jgi:hypothetical protein
MQAVSRRALVHPHRHGAKYLAVTSARTKELVPFSERARAFLFLNSRLVHSSNSLRFPADSPSSFSAFTV